MGIAKFGPKNLLASGRILVKQELAKIEAEEQTLQTQGILEINNTVAAIEKTVTLEVEKIVEVIKEVPTYIDREVIKYVEVPVEKIVERIVQVEVPVVQTVEKIVEVPKEVIQYMDRLVIKQKVPSILVRLLWVETALIVALIISKFV